MNLDNENETFADWIAKVFLSVFIVCLIIGGGKSCINKKEETTMISSPVENKEIDSIFSTNDILNIKVESLDIIKYDKVNEVKSLDNDSTLKLFYELIRK